MEYRDTNKMYVCFVYKYIVCVCVCVCVCAQGGLDHIKNKSFNFFKIHWLLIWAKNY